MPSPFDTIVALITAPGRAAIAVVRVSGPEAWEVARRVFAPWPETPESHCALFGRFHHGDDGLALPFGEGHGYTGDQAVEFSIHGSPASVRALVAACRAAGARDAVPGEFSQRAFLNGRIDLSQAEGVRDTVEALTDAQLRAANRLRTGALRRQVGALRNECLSALAAIEASVDFSEEVGDVDRVSLAVGLESLGIEIGRLLATAHRGRVLRGGLTIAICGLPNAGKSSLLNALLGADRAIVTNTPGATRDTLEAWTELGGTPCRLIDTAGLRHADDPIEAEGVARARRAAEEADLVWYLFDASRGWTLRDEDACPPGATRIRSKADLAPPSGAELRVSSVTGEGLEALENLVQQASDRLDGADEALIQDRHAPLLERAHAGVRQAVDTLRSELPYDLASVGLGDAAAALGEITGETATAHVLEAVFSRFCIGK